MKVRLSITNNSVLNKDFLKFKEVILRKINKYVYGYNNDKIEEIVLSEKIQKVSATKIRKEMRKKGKLK